MLILCTAPAYSIRQLSVYNLLMCAREAEKACAWLDSI